VQCHQFLADNTYRLAELLRKAESRGILLQDAFQLADVGYWLQNIDWQTKFLRVVLAFAQDPSSKTLRPGSSRYPARLPMDGLSGSKACQRACRRAFWRSWIRRCRLSGPRLLRRKRPASRITRPQWLSRRDEGGEGGGYMFGGRSVSQHTWSGLWFSVESGRVRRYHAESGASMRYNMGWHDADTDTDVHDFRRRPTHETSESPDSPNTTQAARRRSSRRRI